MPWGDNEAAFESFLAARTQAAGVTATSLATFGSSYGTEQGASVASQFPGGPRRGYAWTMRLAAALGNARLLAPAVGGGNAVMQTLNLIQSNGFQQYPYMQGIAAQILQRVAVGGPGGAWPASTQVPGPPYDYYMNQDFPAQINAMIWGINEPAALGPNYINAHAWAMRYAIEALLSSAYAAHNDSSIAYSGGSNVLDTVKGIGPGYRLHTTADNGATITITNGPFNASWPGTSDVSFMFLCRQDCIASVTAKVDGVSVPILQKGVSAASQGLVGFSNASPNSIQWVQPNASGGSWTPAIGGVNGTSIAWNATPAQMQASLRTIAGYSTVGAGPFTNTIWGNQATVPNGYKVTMLGATLPAPNITIGVNALTGQGATVNITDNQWGYQYVTIPKSSLPAGAHTVQLTLSVGVGQVGFNGYSVRSVNPATILVPNINRIPASGYLVYVLAQYPFVINDALVAQYNAALTPIAAEYATINGGPASAVNFVDLDAAIGGAGGQQSLMSSDALHANNAGHAEIAKAYYAAIPPQTVSQRMHAATGFDAGWQVPVFSNNWGAATSNLILFLGNTQGIRYRRDPVTNMVYLQGAVVRSTGSPANLETMFTLPPSYLPENPIIVQCRTDTGFTSCAVQPVQGVVAFLNPTGFANPTAATGYVWFDASWYSAA